MSHPFVTNIVTGILIAAIVLVFLLGMGFRLGIAYAKPRTCVDYEQFLLTEYPAKELRYFDWRGGIQGWYICHWD